MSNEVFNFQPDSPFSEEIEWLTVVSESEGGKEQRYQKWVKPKRTFRLHLSSRQLTETTNLWRMYQRMKGSFDTFLFQNPNENPVTAEVVGSGDGQKSVFYLGNNVDVGSGDLISVPGSDTFTRSVGGTGDFLAFSAYTITTSVGQITTNAVLPSGDVLKATYNFYYRVRFKEQSMSRDLFTANLWSIGVDLLEVI